MNLMHLGNERDVTQQVRIEACEPAMRVTQPPSLGACVDPAPQCRAPDGHCREGGDQRDSQCLVQAHVGLFSLEAPGAMPDADEGSRTGRCCVLTPR
jgi:hypothetical protein